MGHLRNFLLAVVLCNISQQAFAQGAGSVAANISAAYLKTANATSDTTSVSSDSSVQVDTEVEDTYRYTSASLCYMLDSMFCLGARYVSNEHVREVTRTVTGSSSTTKQTTEWTGLGPSVGLIHNGFFILGSYLFQNEKTVKTSGTTSAKAVYNGGQAYILDLGYGFDVSGSLKVGPQVSFIHYDYKKVKESDEPKRDIDGDLEDDHIVPYFALWYMF